MAAAQSELSMDEILASIRRIIHEEEDPRDERPRDTTNTVDLREEREKPSNPADILAEAEAKDVREVQVTSAAPAPRQAPAPTPRAKTTPAPTPPQPQDPAISDEAIDESFGTAGLRALVSDEVAARKISAKPLAKPPVADDKPRAQDAAPMAAAAAAEAPVQPTPEPEIPVTAQTALAAEETTPSALVSEPTPAPAAEEQIVETAVSSLLAGAEAEGITAAFAGLKKSVEISHSAGSKTLEAMVEDMLRPMLKAWLEQNLRPMVEAKIDAEIKRLAGK